MPQPDHSPSEPPPVLQLPLGVFPAGSDPLSPRAEAWWLWTFVAVGLAVRLMRYLLRFPLWEDEALLSANYLDRDYLGLLQPLDGCQICPPLFLWCQLTVLKGLGFTEYSLRLIPCLCALVSVPLFRHVAGRLLRGTALVLAVGVFAVAYPMVRYTAEAKPYSSDLLLGLLLLGLTIAWLRRPGQTRWLWALAALAGPAIGFSFPAVFVAGGVSLVVAWVLWTPRTEGKRHPGGTRSPFAGTARDQASLGARLCTNGDCPLFPIRGWRPWIALNLMLLVELSRRSWQ